MEHLENSTAPSERVAQMAPQPQGSRGGDGSAYLYILVVMSFYGVFLCGIMLGYFRSKRREQRRMNFFTRLVHEEEQREWGALPKKHSPPFSAHVSGARAPHVSLPVCGNHGNQAGAFLQSPLACALCAEQSSVSSLCSSADTRLTIEEEEGPEETPAETPAETPQESSGDDSG